MRLVERRYVDDAGVHRRRTAIRMTRLMARHAGLRPGAIVIRDRDVSAGAGAQVPGCGIRFARVDQVSRGRTVWTASVTWIEYPEDGRDQKVYAQLPGIGEQGE